MNFGDEEGMDIFQEMKLKLKEATDAQELAEEEVKRLGKKLKDATIKMEGLEKPDKVFKYCDTGYPRNYVSFVWPLWGSCSVLLARCSGEAVFPIGPFLMQLNGKGFNLEFGTLFWPI